MIREGRLELFHTGKDGECGIMCDTHAELANKVQRAIKLSPLGLVSDLSFSYYRSDNSNTPSWNTSSTLPSNKVEVHLPLHQLREFLRCRFPTPTDTFDCRPDLALLEAIRVSYEKGAAFFVTQSEGHDEIVTAPAVAFAEVQGWRFKSLFSML